MPKDVIRTGQYVTCTKQVNHGDPCVEGGVTGIALKQQTPKWDAALATHKTIVVGEPFLIRDKGTVEVAALAGAKGTPVYIVTATNVLQTAVPGAGTGFPFGRIADLAGERGTPTGRMMVDMDLKDNINTP
jgi:hypothetical protein